MSGVEFCCYKFVLHSDESTFLFCWASKKATSGRPVRPRYPQGYPQSVEKPVDKWGRLSPPPILSTFDEDDGEFRDPDDSSFHEVLANPQPIRFTR